MQNIRIYREWCSEPGPPSQVVQKERMACELFVPFTEWKLFGKWHLERLDLWMGDTSNQGWCSCVQSCSPSPPLYRSQSCFSSYMSVPPWLSFRRFWVFRDPRRFLELSAQIPDHIWIGGNFCWRIFQVYIYMCVLEFGNNGLYKQSHSDHRCTSSISLQEFIGRRKQSCSSVRFLWPQTPMSPLPSDLKFFFFFFRWTRDCNHRWKGWTQWKSKKNTRHQGRKKKMKATQTTYKTPRYSSRLQKLLLELHNSLSPQWNMVHLFSPPWDMCLLESKKTNRHKTMTRTPCRPVNPVAVNDDLASDWSVGLRNNKHSKHKVDKIRSVLPS